MNAALMLAREGGVSIPPGIWAAISLRNDMVKLCTFRLCLTRVRFPVPNHLRAILPVVGL